MVATGMQWAAELSQSDWRPASQVVQVAAAEHKEGARASTYDKHTAPRPGDPEKGDARRTDFPRKKPEGWGKGPYPPKDDKGLRKFYWLFKYLPKGFKLPSVPPLIEPLLDPYLYPTIQQYLPAPPDDIAGALPRGTSPGG
jgi:hypothetical protein